MLNAYAVLYRDQLVKNLIHKNNTKYSYRSSSPPLLFTRNQPRMHEIHKVSTRFKNKIKRIGGS